MPDLLTRTVNGTGATPSPSATGHRPPTTTATCPFNVETLAAVTVDDGNGVASTREYIYADGYYDPEDAEFRGFSLIEQTLPDHTTEGDPFPPGRLPRGKEHQVDHKDPADRLLTKTTLDVADTQYGAARFVQLQ